MATTSIRLPEIDEIAATSPKIRINDVGSDSTVINVPPTMMINSVRFSHHAEDVACLGAVELTSVTVPLHTVNHSGHDARANPIRQ